MITLEVTDRVAGFECSNCGGEILICTHDTYWHYYCPDCGADSADDESELYDILDEQEISSFQSKSEGD